MLHIIQGALAGMHASGCRRCVCADQHCDRIHRLQRDDCDMKRRILIALATAGLWALGGILWIWEVVETWKQRVKFLLSY